MRIRNLQGMRIKIEEEEGRGGEQEEPIDLSSGRREKTLPQVPFDPIRFHSIYIPEILACHWSIYVT